MSFLEQKPAAERLNDSSYTDKLWRYIQLTLNAEIKLTRFLSRCFTTCLFKLEALKRGKG